MEGPGEKIRLMLPGCFSKTMTRSRVEWDSTGLFDEMIVSQGESKQSLRLKVKEWQRYKEHEKSVLNRHLRSSNKAIG